MAEARGYGSMDAATLASVSKVLLQSCTVRQDPDRGSVLQITSAGQQYLDTLEDIYGANRIAVGSFVAMLHHQIHSAAAAELEGGDA